MKHFKKILVTVTLSLSLMLGSIASSALGFTSPFVLTVLAGDSGKHTGGRIDATLGDHNDSIAVTVLVSRTAWIQMRDKNWNLIWEGSAPDKKVFYCGPDIYTVSLYLEIDAWGQMKW